MIREKETDLRRRNFEREREREKFKGYTLVQRAIARRIETQRKNREIIDLQSEFLRGRERLRKI